MKPLTAMLLAATLASWGCRQAPGNEAEPSRSEPPAQSQNAVTPAAEPEENETAAVPKGSLPEPNGPIDPKSVEAAGQVVQHYGALIETSRFLQAERLWNDVNAARAFATALDAKFKDVHLEIGELGATEGAAGSIYTEVPVTFYGQSERNKGSRLPASVVLRRVNDVPGSTERQRRWHIERIDWKSSKAG